MASCQTAQWGNSSPYVRLTVTESSSTGTVSTLSWILDYVAPYAASSSANKNYSVIINGITVKSGSYTIGGKTGTNQIAAGTVNIAKTNVNQTVSFGISFAFNLTWSGIYKGTMSAFDSILVPSKTSYTIAYNANGGGGAPSSQTKWAGETTTISNSKPSRTGYTFGGWSTTSTGTVEYVSGASYTADASATLYAVWTALTYRVQYNDNGGTGVPSEQTKVYGTALTLSGVTPTRAKYTFQGWGVAPSSTTPTYYPNSDYTQNAAITLYAVWKLAYVAPRITNFSLERCNPDGTVDIEYAPDPVKTNGAILVTFNWISDYPIKRFYFTYKLTSSSNWTVMVDPVWDTTIVGKKSGSFSYVCWMYDMQPESAYDVQVEFKDDLDGVTPTSGRVSGTIFTIDCLAGGNGVAFGKAADLDGFADCNFNFRLRKNAYIDDQQSIIGYSSTGNEINAFQPRDANGNTKIGYGNYTAKSGITYLYGNDILFGVANPNPTGSGVYKPYRSRGDSFDITFRTAGYVTNSGKEVSFWLPISEPIVGGPVVSVTSLNGFVLRQNGLYTHGSSSSVYATPSSYEAIVHYEAGIYIKATFNDVTNAVNNDSIGILWSGTVSFS